MNRVTVIIMALALGMTLNTGLSQAQQAKDQSRYNRMERQGQARDQTQGRSDQAESRTDRNFFKQAAQGGQFEVQIGQLAQQKAQNPQVKQLAQMLASEHTQANQQLQDIAQRKQVQLSTDLPQRDQRRMERLRGLSGNEFDSAFVQEVIRNHRRDIELYQRQAQSGTDPDVKNFAQTTLPKLQQHLQQAESIWASIQGGSSQQGSSSQQQGSGAQQQGGSSQQQGGSSWQQQGGSSQSQGGAQSGSQGSMGSGSQHQQHGGGR